MTNAAPLQAELTRAECVRVHAHLFDACLDGGAEGIAQTRLEAGRDELNELLANDGTSARELSVVASRLMRSLQFDIRNFLLVLPEAQYAYVMGMQVPDREMAA